MNEDFPADSERPKSRWTVEPGSVSNAYRRRHGVDDEDDVDAQPRRRSAADILAEAQRSGTPTTRSRRRDRLADQDTDETPARPAGALDEDPPTQVSVRRPAVPRDLESPAEPRDRGRHAVPRDTERERAASRAAAAAPIVDLDDDDDLDYEPRKTGPTRATPKRPAVPKASDKKRGTPLNAPEQGQRTELRAPQGLGHQPAAILAGFGGVLLIVIATAIGGIIDLLVSGSIGLFGAIGLCVGAAFAALITRKRDLLSILVAAPIVYAILGFLVLLVSSRPVTITSVAGLAINGFPAMAIATGLAAIVIGIKLLTTRVGERR